MVGKEPIKVFLVTSIPLSIIQPPDFCLLCKQDLENGSMFLKDSILSVSKEYRYKGTRNKRHFCMRAVTFPQSFLP